MGASLDPVSQARRLCHRPQGATLSEIASETGQDAQALLDELKASHVMKIDTRKDYQTSWTILGPALHYRVRDYLSTISEADEERICQELSLYTRDVNKAIDRLRRLGYLISEYTKAGRRVYTMRKEQSDVQADRAS